MTLFISAHSLSLLSYQLEALAKRVGNSPILTDKLHNLCREEKLAAVGLKTPVRTRWNSLCTMLERALKIRAPVDNLVQLPQLRKMNLSKYQLSDEEWKIMEDLYPLLDVSLIL